MTGERPLELAERYLSQRETSDALAAFSEAELSGADLDRCAAGRWTAYMLRGEFEGAWQQSDSIRHRGSHDPHRFWLGESLAGKQVIVRCLHGLGDTVQFMQYASRLRAITSRTVWEVPPQLVEIARHVAGVEHVVTWGEDAPTIPPSWELQIEVTELPYIFRTAATDLPIRLQYLNIPQSRQSNTLPRSSNLRVGIVWTAGDWNPIRSIPLEVLRPILELPGIDFINLQGGEARGWSGLENGMLDSSVDVRGVLPLASAISQLDLVLTVDTLAAHLAGAIGVTTWVMLPFVADWRWMLHRADTPWYPSLRLFRQNSPGAWHSLVDQVRSCLLTLLNSSSENVKA